MDSFVHHHLETWILELIETETTRWERDTPERTIVLLCELNTHF